MHTYVHVHTHRLNFTEQEAKNKQGSTCFDPCLKSLALTERQPGSNYKVLTIASKTPDPPLNTVVSIKRVQLHRGRRNSVTGRALVTMLPTKTASCAYCLLCALHKT
jgi:hypothetical protein